MAQNLIISWIILGIGLFCIFIKSTEGRRYCYVCDTKNSGIDCLNNPDNLTSITTGSSLIPEKPCRHYCTIVRKEYINIPGSVSISSLQRGCEEHPLILDGVSVGGYFYTYYRSCRSNLCNGGDGIESLKDIAPDETEGDDYYDEENSSLGLHYYENSMRILKIYFFVFVAFIFSIT